MVFSSWIGFLPNTPFQALEACIVSMITDYHDVLMGVSPDKTAKAVGGGVKGSDTNCSRDGLREQSLLCCNVF